MSNDLRTIGIVLRRTNYGEADRILNILTPQGKISVIAKGVRRAKSKLAGSVETFCLSELVIHQGKSQLGILTSAKMIKFYQNIVSNLATIELASQITKQLNRVAGDVDSADYFDLLQQSLDALDSGADLAVVRLWFHLNFQRLGGEEYNLYTDSAGAKLSPEQHYRWDRLENALSPDANGPIAAAEIKLARLMTTSKLVLVTRVDGAADIARHILSSF